MKSEPNSQNQDNTLQHPSGKFYASSSLNSFFKGLQTLHSSPFTLHIKKIFKNPWFIALVLLGIFLATNGYIYGWDDQHVEIPLLKKLIDPTLYPNDYYVDALKTNFMSYLYPVLAKIITVDQIPAVYFILYLISRYFLFFFMFKIWHAITKHSGPAFLCMLMILLIGRVEEFLYRTFSHQEFALAFIFAGIYYFYKNRSLLAAAILGISANIHALYSLFPMCYLGLDLLRQKRWRTLVISGLIFSIAALPFLLWAAQKYFSGAEGMPAPPASEWIPLYQLACPQNFMFYHSDLSHILSDWKNFWDGTGSYWLLGALSLMLFSSCKEFRQDHKTHSILFGGWLMLVVTFVFSYIRPIRFFLDLNLIRNGQYMLFFLMGYLIIFLWELRESHPWKFFLCLLTLPLVRFGTYHATLSVAITGCIAHCPDMRTCKNITAWLKTCALCAAIITSLGFLIYAMGQHRYSARTWMTLWATLIGISACVIPGFIIVRIRKLAFTLAMILPFLITMLNYADYHREFRRVQRHGAGFWQLQRNWIDMQKFVQKNTPTDALLLVPHDMEMGGFRIQSERTIVLSYRDCGVVGFNYAAAQEWQRRLNHMQPFQVIAKDPYLSALILAISYYKVDYIVFMRYMTLPDQIPFLRSIYENETFKLYQVIRKEGA